MISGTPADSRAASSHFAGFVNAYLGTRAQRIVEAVAKAADGLGWSPLEVALGGHTWNGEGLDAETVNGPLERTIPADYSARLETGTENGPMNVNFPITMTVQGRLNRRLSTVLGSGGPTVRAVTTNGPVEINRR